MPEDTFPITIYPRTAAMLPKFAPAELIHRAVVHYCATLEPVEETPKHEGRKKAFCINFCPRSEAALPKYGKSDFVRRAVIAYAAANKNAI